MEPKHYTPKELDDAVAQERERCLSMCRMVMDHHSEIAKIAAQEFDEENKTLSVTARPWTVTDCTNPAPKVL